MTEFSWEPYVTPVASQWMGAKRPGLSRRSRAPRDRPHGRGDI